MEVSALQTENKAFPQLMEAIRERDGQYLPKLSETIFDSSSSGESFILDEDSRNALAWLFSNL